MSDSLSTYLNDHLAGAMFATELLEHLRKTHAGAPLGQLASRMLAEIEEDRAVLQRLSDEVGGGGGSALKEASAWVAEKTARLKLQLGAKTQLGEFEALETLSLGVLGKLKLWQALAQIAPLNARLRELDFDQLAARARTQHDEVELHRLEAAKKALTT